MSLHDARQIWGKHDLEVVQYEDDDSWGVTSESWPEHLQDVFTGASEDEALQVAIEEGARRLVKAQVKLEYMRRFESNPLLRYSPTPPGLAFLSDGRRRKLIRGPNQLGKTAVCVIEVLNDIFGDPYKPRWNPHIEKRTWWVLCNSWRQSKVIEQAIRDWVPAEYVNWQVCGFSTKNGWTSQYIEFTGGPWAGSWIRIKTQGQDKADLASETLTGGIWVDEPLRDGEIYTELEGRVARHNARLIYSVTPSGDLSLLRERCIRVFLDGRAAEPETTDGIEVRLFKSADDPGCIADHQFRLIPENAVTIDGQTVIRTPEQISEYLSILPKNLVPQRRDGAWTGPSDWAAFEAWDDSMWGARPAWDPEHDVTLHIGTDWGAVAGSTCAYLVAIQRWSVEGSPRSRVHVYGEYVSESATQLLEDAENILEMLRAVMPDVDRDLGIQRDREPTDRELVGMVDGWFVDQLYGGSPKHAVERKTRHDFARHIDSLVGYRGRRRGDHAAKVRTVNKPSGRTRVDIKLLNGLMKVEHFSVSRHCRRLPTALATWDGTVDDRTPWMKGGQRKHLVDGLRYPVTEVVLGKKRLELEARRATHYRIA